MSEASPGSRAARDEPADDDVEPDNGDVADTGAGRRRDPRAVFAAVHPWVTLVLRLLLAGVLGVAGILKVGDPLSSARAVRVYDLLPESLVVPIGYGLPFLEIALAVLLLLGLAVRFCGVASGLLMLAFIIAIASVWARGISIDCGCFGGGGEVGAAETKYPIEILRDAGLVIAAAWLTIFPSGRFALDTAVLGESTQRGK